MRLLLPGVLGVFSLLFAAVDAGLGSTPRPGPTGRLDAYSRLPLTFEENHGQADASVRFVARGPDYTVLLGAADATVRLPRGAGTLRMTLVGGGRTPRVAALDPQAAVSHYLLGNDPAGWRPNVPHYASVRYEQVYDGIDLIYYGNQRQLEHDFLLAPAADPEQIALEFAGAQAVDVTPDGDLLVHLNGAAVRFHRPVAYQREGATRTAVNATYDVDDRQRVRFALGDYDVTRELVIDPVLSYSSYGGGAGSDYAYGIAVDASGSTYVTGATDSLDFPSTAGAFSRTFAGTTGVPPGGDAFVLKLDAAGSLVYSTYVGGSNTETARAIAVDSSGNAYITGSTSSTNYPTTSGSLQPRIGNHPFSSNGDMFVTKLNAAGSGLVYSTYLGGRSATKGFGIAVDSNGSAYVTGEAWLYFRTPNPLIDQTTNGYSDAFIAKLTPSGSGLEYATLLGGSDFDEGYGIAIDGSANAYILGRTSSSNLPVQNAAQPVYGGGQDAFVARFNASGGRVYSTFLGGNSSEVAGGIAVDAAGNAYVTGGTDSSNFPVTAGALQTTKRPFYDAFVTKLSPSGSFAYSTFLGGALADNGNAIAVDASGNAFVIGTTQSSDFPSRTPVQPALGSSTGDLFVTELNPAGSATVFSTFLGGTARDEGNAIALDASLNVYLAGRTQSTNFPTLTPFQAASRGGSDIFIVKLRTAVPTVTVDRSALVFAVTTTGTGAARTAGPITPPQSLRLAQTGTGVVTWTAKTDQTWLTVSPVSGTVPAGVTTTASVAGGIPSGSTATAKITFTFVGAGPTTATVDVTLNITDSGSSPPPIGTVDTPADGSVLAGSVGVTGWSLDNIGVKRVELWRDLQPGEPTPTFASSTSDPRNGKIFIGNATFVDGARPDVEGLYASMPFAYRGGWGYLLLTWGLYNRGNGNYKLYAFSFDQEEHVSTLGVKSVTFDNNAATKPFGSIDTPAIGGDASGPNFGWALTPKVNGVATCKIQPSGVQYSIDSGPLQPVVYGDARADIAGAFPGFSNTAAAGGHAIIDWSALTSGPHTIGWLITDDCNRSDGVGSRFFNVTSGISALTAREFRLTAEASPSAPFRLKAEATGPDFVASGSSLVASAFRRKDADVPLVLTRGYNGSAEVLVAGENGHTIEIRQAERIELRLPRGFDSAYQLGPAGQRRALPAGSTWDAGSETFYWQPAPGFLGGFRLVFTNGSQRLGVRVIVTP